MKPSDSADLDFGPLDALLHDQSVSEIIVNGPDEVSSSGGEAAN